MYPTSLSSGVGREAAQESKGRAMHQQEGARAAEQEAVCCVDISPDAMVLGGQVVNSGPAGNPGHAEPAVVLWVPGAADAGHLQPLVPDVRHDGLRRLHAQGGPPLTAYISVWELGVHVPLCPVKPAC